MPIRIEHAIKETTTPAALASVGAKKLYVKSYGCQMNVYDGLRIADMMAPLGYTLQDKPEDADLVVLNTCHIREKADDKVFSDIGRIKPQLADDAIIAVGGCTGQALGAKIYQQQPVVSVVFGPQTYHRLPKLIEKVEQGRLARLNGHKNTPIRAVDTDFPELEKFDALPRPGAYGPTAFVTIQEGCDKFCTYCVVPYTRGAEISRSVTHIVDEVEKLAEQGVREVTLLGQNVNAYLSEDADGNPVTLAKLCAEIGKIDAIARIRFTTSHPNNTTPDLIDAFVTNPKLMPYFHLPVQAGSNKILAAMNRNHTAESYLETIAKIKAARPDIAMSGDFIVGFPGETEADFQQTLAVIAATEYASAYSFAYSPRPGTPAAEMENQVDELTKKERLAALQALLDSQQQAFNARFMGAEVEVLLEENGKQAGQVRGRSAHNVVVNVVGVAPAEQPALMGKIVRARVTEVRPRSLIAEYIPATAA